MAAAPNPIGNQGLPFTSIHSPGMTQPGAKTMNALADTIPILAGKLSAKSGARGAAAAPKVGLVAVIITQERLTLGIRTDNEVCGARASGNREPDFLRGCRFG